MKNKVLKQMLAFSLAVALVGGNSVATFAAEPTNGIESSANTQAATDATAEKVAVVNFKLDIENPIIRINTAFKGCSSLEKISVLPRIYHN